MVQIPIAKPLIGPKEKAAVAAVLDSGILAQGPRVAEFERAFAAYCGAAQGVATSNGTTALHLALLAAGVGPGDEVVTTPFSFFATGSTILMCGATPVFVDIEPATFNLDPQAVAAAVTEKTKAVLAVHLYGLPCDMDPLRELCEAEGLVLIEDACQAHGAEYKGRRAGTLGDMACFSFYPTKNMTCGEGGMVTTDSEELAEKVRLLRAHGQPSSLAWDRTTRGHGQPGSLAWDRTTRGHGQASRYEHVLMGYNFRLTDIAAAIGLIQLQRLPDFNKARRENAGWLNEGLSDIEGLTLPRLTGEGSHVYHQYTVRAKQRDQLKAHLEQVGVGHGIYYPRLIFENHPMKPFVRPCPQAQQAAKEVLSLPVHPGLNKGDIDIIVKSVNDFYRRA